MNSLTQGIEYAIKNAIEEYSNLITSKYKNVDTKGLEDIWNGVSKGMKITVSFKSTIVKDEKTEKVSSKKKSSTNRSQDGSSVAVLEEPDDRDIIGNDTYKVRDLFKKGETCPYLFTKGKREGEECGSKSKGGMVYCSRHKKHEGCTPKVKKSIPKPTKVIKKSIVNINKKTSAKKIKQRVLKKNKEIDRLWNVETMMVFESAKDRTVIGKCVEDTIVLLTDDDIETCKEWGFAYRIPKKVLEEEVLEEEEEEVLGEEEEVLGEEEEEVLEEEVLEEEEEEVLEEEVLGEEEEEVLEEEVLEEEVLEEEEEEVLEEEEEEVLEEEEEVLEEEEEVNKIARSITSVTKKPVKTVLTASSASGIKKSIAAAISETNIQAKDVESILGELKGEDVEEYVDEGDEGDEYDEGDEGDEGDEYVEYDDDLIE
jgi:hypothetical protein